MSCSKETTQTPTNEVFKTESSGVKNGILDAKYTCDGSSISPPISWGAVPVGTKSFAITMHHIPPTGDKHVYYLLYNIPATVTSISENNTSIGSFGINTVNGKNSYTPPCSQGPGPKVYVITVYALSAQPVINQAASKVTMDVLTEAMANITLSKSELSVTYSRP
ncbi:MAG: YbhB/YbcL family Raf kinase inhibitor-like protein [Spirosomataceae bacterium]